MTALTSGRPVQVRRFAVIVLMIGLGAATGGCGHAPTVPSDTFYRLPSSPSAPAPGQSGSGARTKLPWVGLVAVEPLRADGVHRERALVYSEDVGALSLSRYHYHFWVDPPPALLRDYLARRLRAAAPTATVLPESGTRPDISIGGRVRRFDHLRGSVPGGEQAVVDLELRVQEAGARLPALVRDYTARAPVRGGGMIVVVEAFGAAVERIVSDFLSDAARLRPVTRSPPPPGARRYRGRSDDEPSDRCPGRSRTRACSARENDRDSVARPWPDPSERG